MKITNNYGINPAEQIASQRTKDVPKDVDDSSNNSMKIQDKLEISEGAKMMMNKSVSGKDLSEVRDRIRNGFYNSDQVLGVVADAILKEFK